MVPSPSVRWLHRYSGFSTAFCSSSTSTPRKLATKLLRSSTLRAAVWVWLTLSYIWAATRTWCARFTVSTDFYTSGKNAFNLIMRNITKVVVNTQVRTNLSTLKCFSIRGIEFYTLLASGIVHYFRNWRIRCHWCSNVVGLLPAKERRIRCFDNSHDGRSNGGIGFGCTLLCRGYDFHMRFGGLRAKWRNRGSTLPHEW